jgi:hypothetical protein
MFKCTNIHLLNITSFPIHPSLILPTSSPLSSLPDHSPKRSNKHLSITTRSKYTLSITSPCSSTTLNTSISATVVCPSAPPATRFVRSIMCARAPSMVWNARFTFVAYAREWERGGKCRVTRLAVRRGWMENGKWGGYKSYNFGIDYLLGCRWGVDRGNSKGLG